MRSTWRRWLRRWHGNYRSRAEICWPGESTSSAAQGLGQPAPHQPPTSLARSFVDSIRAPAKAFVPIEGGGHFAVFVKSTAFLDQLVSRVRALAAR